MRQKVYVCKLYIVVSRRYVSPCACSIFNAYSSIIRRISVVRGHTCMWMMCHSIAFLLLFISSRFITLSAQLRKMKLSLGKKSIFRPPDYLNNNNNNLYVYMLTLSAATAVINRGPVQYYKLIYN